MAMAVKVEYGNGGQNTALRGLNMRRMIDLYEIDWDVGCAFGLAAGRMKKNADIPINANCTADYRHPYFPIFSNPELEGQTLIGSGSITCKSVGSSSRPGIERSFEIFLQMTTEGEVDIFVKISAVTGTKSFAVLSADILYCNFQQGLTFKCLNPRLENIPASEKPKIPVLSREDINEDSNNAWWVKVTVPAEKSGFIHLYFEFVLERIGIGETDDVKAALHPLIPQGGLLNTTEFLFSRQFSDVVVVCGEFEYPAHRNIICSKSKVLETMFLQPMAENLTGKLEIKDAEPEIVEEFLRFLYTGAVTDFAKNASGLFLLADKYDVQDLKALSEQTILETMTNENVLELYGVGKLLGSDAIVRQCIQKIKMDKKLIWKTKEESLAAAQQLPDLFFNMAFLE